MRNPDGSSSPGFLHKGLPSLWDYKGRVVVICLLAMISGATGAALVVMIQKVANGQMHGDIHAAWLAIAYLTTITSGVLAAQVTFRTTSAMAADLRLGLGHRLFASPLAALEAQGPTKIRTILIDDVNRVGDVLETAPLISQNIIIVFGVLAYLLWVDLYLAFSILLFTIAASAIYIKIQMRARVTLRSIRRKGVEVDSAIADMIGGIKELKLNMERQRRFLSEDYAGALESFRDHNVAGSSTLSMAQSAFRAMTLLGLLLLVVYSSASSQGHIATGVLLILVFGLAPLTAVLRSGSNWVSLGRSYNEILQLVADLGEAESPYCGDVERARWKPIELRDVIFRYDEDGQEQGFSLGPISLRLDSEQIIGVVGANGSGKTTLAKVLAGLYPPQCGQICLDGIPVTLNTLQEYRRQIGAIFSDAHLFDHLVPSSTVSVQDIEKFLATVGMQDKVSLEGYRISRKRVSAGQRKRLALLDLFAQDRPVLVLDEWAAEQDPHFRKTFYQTILPWFRSQGKCVIVISHDHGYIDRADRIIRLEDGRISDISDTYKLSAVPVPGAI